MYHLELRQFPHNLCRFNLTEQELRATVLEPWAKEQWIELGERKWSPHQAKLTVIAGPRLELDQLSMGRGWRTAQREGRDVTEQLLAAAGPTPASAAPDTNLLADSLALELLSQLGSDPTPLPRAWELAAARHPGTASESLAVAERAVAALLRSQLIVLLRADIREGASEREPQPVAEAEIEDILAAPASWIGAAAAQVWMRRA